MVGECPGFLVLVSIVLIDGATCNYFHRYFRVFVSV